MRKLDIIIFAIAILILCFVLLLIKALFDPQWFDILTKIGILEASKEGIKNAFVMILACSTIVFVLVLLVFLRMLGRVMKK